MLDTYREDFHQDHLWAMPVIAKTYDGTLNDINSRHVSEQHVRAALDSAASGSIAEGNVGGGTGMMCFEFKGGTGTASRPVVIDGETCTIAALVQANYGIRPWLTILGVSVGKYLTEDRIRQERELGSIIAVIATDAPMLPHQLQRVPKRGAPGIGRCGSPGGNSSGEIFLAFSVAHAAPLATHNKAHLNAQYINNEYFDGFYAGAVDAVEEAIFNAMIAAPDTPTINNPADPICRSIPQQQLVEIMRRHGRCA